MKSNYKYVVSTYLWLTCNVWLQISLYPVPKTSKSFISHFVFVVLNIDFVSLNALQYFFVIWGGVLIIYSILMPMQKGLFQKVIWDSI